MYYTVKEVKGKDLKDGDEYWGYIGSGKNGWVKVKDLKPYQGELYIEKPFLVRVSLPNGINRDELIKAIKQGQKDWWQSEKDKGSIIECIADSVLPLLHKTVEIKKEDKCKFFEWCDTHYHYKGGDNWAHGSGGNEKYFKTEDLFKIYKQQGN